VPDNPLSMTSYQLPYHLRHRDTSLSFTTAVDPERLSTTNPSSSDCPPQHRILHTEDSLPTNDRVTHSHFYDGLPMMQAGDSEPHWPVIYDLSSSHQLEADSFSPPYTPNTANTVEYEFERPINGEALCDYHINSASFSPRSYPDSFSFDSIMLEFEPRAVSQSFSPSSYFLDPRKHEQCISRPGSIEINNTDGGLTETYPWSFSHLGIGRNSSHRISPLFTKSSPPAASSTKATVDIQSRISEDADGDRYSDGHSEPDGNEGPYAQLIYKALLSVPDHKMVLKDIYEWFEKHTDKAKNPNSKGWQNSIRHNLSMNGVRFTVKLLAIEDTKVTRHSGRLK